MKRLAMLSLVLLLCTGLLWAQSDRATITGTVKDATGAVIPGVQVTATNTENGTKGTAFTNDLGMYTVLHLPIGPYTMTFSKGGFKQLERKGVNLGVNQVADINVTLAIGGASEIVTVIEDAPVLDTQTAAVGLDLKQKAIMDLPITASGGRVLEDFAYKVIPGVEGNNWQEHIAGSMAQTKEVLIDGTSAVQQIGGHLTESSPSMEAVEEFQVSTSGLRAEDGRTGGGVFRMNLKSGSNDFHGSVFGFMHNEVLNANSWNNKYLAATNPTLAPNLGREKDRKFDYGFSVGGPIIKNKTFFFTAFERYTQESLALGGRTTVPNADFLRGDFSALLGNVITGEGGPILNPCTGTAYVQGQIFDPATRRTVNGQVCADPFPNNIIPTNRISAVSGKILNIYSQYYQPEFEGVKDNARRIAAIDPWFHQNQWTTKFDHNFSDANRLSASYIYVRRPRYLSEGGIWQAGTIDGGPLSQTRHHFVHSDAVRLSDSHAFSPSVLNVFSFTYNRFNNPQIAASAEGDWPSQLGLYDSPQGNFPIINFNGDNLGHTMTNIGSGSSNHYTAHTYYFNDNLSWIKGRHTLKFGADVRFYQMNSHSDQNVVNYNFNANTTGMPMGPATVANQTGFSFASFLLGEVESADWKVANNIYGRRKAMSMYIQDDIKITSKLTANLDLRWEFNGRYHEKYGRWSNFNMDAINPVTGRKGVLEFAKDGDDSFERNQFYGNFAPHVGLAYELTPKTVLRGSYGMYYSPINLSYWSGVPYGFNPGFVGDNRITPRTDFSPAFNWDQNGYPGVTVEPTRDPSFTRWGMVSVHPDSLKPGRVQQFNFDLQREITKDLRFDVRYMGTRGTNLQSNFLSGNQPDAKAYGELLKRGTIWNWVSDEASAAAAGVPYPTGFSGSAWAALFPYPEVAMTWGPLFVPGAPLGKSRYDSLTLHAAKRSGHGLLMDVSYVLSRSRGSVDTGWQENWWAGPIQDVNNLEVEHKTISPFDQMHVFKGYVAYDLPMGNGKALLSGAGPVLNKIVSGWTLSTIFRYNSGTPLRVTSSNWYPMWNNIYANLNPNVVLGNLFVPSNFDANDPTKNIYFDPNAFSNPAYGELGNAPGYLDQLRGFGGANEDLGVMKYTSFGPDGRYTLQVRFEMYNIFNRHAFENPVTNISDPNFGRVMRATGDPRKGQIGARFTF